MNRVIFLSIAFTLVLAGCSTRLNPFNWFGGSDENSEIEAVDLEALKDPRPLAASITQLVLEPTPGGAIVRATALPPTQGWYAAELVNIDPNGEPIDGVLAFGFRAVPPKDKTAISSARSREISAGIFVSDITLARVREIRVIGAKNSRSARK